MRFFLLMFVALMDPLTRIGSPTNRANPFTWLIIFGIIGGGAYWYLNSSSAEDDALRLAIEEGYDVSNALNNGANFQSQDSIGRTPLHMAARYDNADAVKLLLEAGADPNLKDYKGRTPLHMTRFDQTNNFETMKILLEGGADPNIQDNRGRTAMDTAKAQLYFSRKKQKLISEHGGI